MQLGSESESFLVSKTSDLHCAQRRMVHFKYSVGEQVCMIPKFLPPEFRDLFTNSDESANKTSHTI